MYHDEKLLSFTWDVWNVSPGMVNSQKLQSFEVPHAPKKHLKSDGRPKNHIFSLFLGMCEHAFSVSFYLCGKVGTCSFLKMLLSNFWLGWDFSQELQVTWPVLDKGWSDLQRHWKHLRKCVSVIIWLHTGWANSNPVIFDQPVGWQKV